MIVITSLRDKAFSVCPGDEFHLSVTDGMDCEVIINEKITEHKTIDFIASYRFALEDGRCPGFHLCGVFGCRDELPKELQEAILLNDLTLEQKENFYKSVGCEFEQSYQMEQ